MITRKYISLLLLLLLPVLSVTTNAQTNRIYLTDIQLEAGSSGTLDVYMENKTSVVGFQFTLTVPQGITLLPQNVTPTNRLENHQLVAQAMGANQYMFAAFSATNEAIGSIQGILFSIPVQIAPDIADNVRYKLNMTSAVMGTKSGNNVLESAYGGEIFVAGQPNLHVTALDCSEAVAGRKMNITWRVRNDGAGPTGDVAWKDYVWLTPDIQGGMSMTDVKLLRIVDNVTALQPGEWYDNSIEVQLEERKYGQYHVVVTSDMYGFNNIELSATGSVLPEVYQPETANYGYLYAQGTASYDQLVESGERNGRSDNFFYKRINIAVPPLPNLKVDQIVALVDNSQDDDSPTPISAIGQAGSTLFYSGKHVKVTARISNIGDAPVNNAVIRDALYMSHSENLHGTVYRMATTNDTISIVPGKSQTITFSTQLPYVWSGNTWFHVQVDTEDAVYEGAATTENIATGDKIDCIQTPTADFKVTSVNAPQQVTLGTPFDVTYKVNNVGPGIPFSSRWTDCIYISKNSYPDSATKLESHSQTGGFTVDQKGNYSFSGDNYTATRRLVLKGLSAGTYYLFVKVDSNDDVYEFDGEGNNWSNPVATILVAADLTVQLISVSPDTLYNDYQASFCWKVKNIGTGTIQNASLTDAFYAKSANGTSHYLGKATNTVSLNPGGEKVLRTNITLPNNSQLNGNMSVYVKTNQTGILESTASNNTSASISKYFKYFNYNVGINPVIPDPLDNRPNLVVTNITAPATITSGAEADISYQLKNIGAGMAEGSVSQEVFLSQTGTFDSQSALPCTIVGEQQSGNTNIYLEPNQTLSRAMRIVVPGNIKGGRYYLHVCVNRDGHLEEVSYSNNSANSQVLVEGLLPDLTVTNLSVPAGVKTSESFKVTWRVENVGTWKSDKTVSDVYLTSNEQPIKLLKTMEVEAMNPSTFVMQTAYLQVEDDIVGDYGIMVVADSAHRQDELSQNNNRAISHFTSTQSPLPNLVLSDLVVDGRLRGCDTITIRALVTNVGDNSTHKEKWSDAFYFSTGYELNTSTDIRLGNKVHVGELARNGSYELTAQLRIPDNAHGYYLLYAVTDDGKSLVEPSYSDNIERRSVFVEDVYDTPAQLTVGSISAPSSITAGALTAIKYTVVNNGQYPATGTLRDVIYLSADDVWDENDIMVGVTEDEVNLLPGESLRRQAIGRVTNVTEGEYYFIVRTNSTHGIVESDYDNNMSVAQSSSRLIFSQLSVGSIKDVLKMGYFKVPVQSIGQSATLGFTLGHNPDQQAGLYVAYERVPSTARYDYASSRLNTNSQEVLVPNVQMGTYYVLAQRNNANTDSFNRWSTRGGISWAVEHPLVDPEISNESPMSISAREVQFGATRLSITEGGTDGWVTTEVQGALFDSIMDFRLERNMEKIPIETLTLNDETSAQVTFNLNRAETGTYDVVSELPDGTRATLPQEFKVVPGISANLGVIFDAPKVTRVSGYGTLNITYANVGNTDVVIRYFLLTVTGGELSSTINGFNEKQNELKLYPYIKQDARGYVTIAPGKQETITCFFRQTAPSSHIFLYLVK